MEAISKEAQYPILQDSLFILTKIEYLTENLANSYLRPSN